MSWKTKYDKAPSDRSKMKPNKVYKSWRADKKLVVKATRGNQSKIVHFGQIGYDDYTAHKDKDRRRRYLARASKIRNKRGKLTKNDIFSPNHWAIKILW